MPLPETTTDRLLAVADIIDLSPERWDQGCWFACELVEPQPLDVTGRGMTCGSVGCIAGWAVALTPLSPHTSFWKSWDVAGRHALGLNASVALRLFRADLPMGPGEVADVLRRLAKLEEGERSLAGARRTLTDEQYELLVSDADDAA
jgi:hypothetical protein